MKDLEERDKKMQFSNECGVIYVATGDKCVKEVVLSAKSLKTSNSNIPITVFTDKENVEVLEKSEFFESVAVIENPQFTWNDKMTGVRRSPYEKTIFLDTDTLVWEPLKELFDGLSYADILACNSPRQFNYEWEKTEYPASIVQYNTGVLCFDTKRSKKFFDMWIHYRKLRPEGGDQIPFREAMLHTNVRIRTIPNEYNCRLGVPQLLVQKVVVAHYGRIHQYPKWLQDKIQNEINRYETVRGWLPLSEKVVRKNKYQDIWFAAFNTVPVILRKIYFKFFN